MYFHSISYVKKIIYAIIICYSNNQEHKQYIMLITLEIAAILFKSITKPFKYLFFVILSIGSDVFFIIGLILLIENEKLIHQIDSDYVKVINFYHQILTDDENSTLLTLGQATVAMFFLSYIFSQIARVFKWIIGARELKRILNL